MNARAAAYPGGERRLLPMLLPVLMFLALAAALVPALFPSGSAMARLYGSAFDPTTSTVTLRVRDESGARIAAQVRDGRDPAPLEQVPPVLAAGPPVEIARFPLVLAVAPATESSARPVAPRRAGIARPRAPPVLT